MVMPDLVGEAQYAFVSGRQNLDEALIANAKKKSKSKALLLKLDFQKVYDTMDGVSLTIF